MSNSILAQAHKVARQLDELSALERARSEAADIRKAFEALEEVRPFVAATTSTYLVLRNRLSSERTDSISADFRLVAQSVHVSKEAFARDRRQASQLQGPVKTQAQQLYSALAAAWREAADTRVRPLIQLLSLVERLPEMQSQYAAAAQLRSRLQAGVQRLPQSETQITAFDADCQAMETLLEGMRGLSTPVKAFLSRVVEGTAGLGDLSDEVLAWCRQGSRSSAFRITFTETSE